MAEKSNLLFSGTPPQKLFFGKGPPGKEKKPPTSYGDSKTIWKCNLKLQIQKAIWRGGGIKVILRGNFERQFQDAIFKETLKGNLIFKGN